MAAMTTLNLLIIQQIYWRVINMEGCTEKHSTKSKPVVGGIFAALKFEWIFAKYVCPQDIMCDSSRFLPRQESRQS